MLWDGHPARSLSLAGKMPALQNILGYFLNWKSLSRIFPPPTPYSLLPTPFPLLPAPYSLLPTPYSLLPTQYLATLYKTSHNIELWTKW